MSGERDNKEFSDLKTQMRGATNLHNTDHVVQINPTVRWCRRYAQGAESITSKSRSQRGSLVKHAAH
ncbi:hypothetical protein M5X11_05755 [Paenibacillus alginolyticus]|uniref:hypothetical protein n=1 Tax=Paenibacillus alginolyticus TaxID=59839 RepID=UPI0004929672|nr:hypothetical protein [Paenibacillus alginolyticus]MCY9664460.1 hypothetical protein [Paenibacillus alginolyticus]